jgi:flagellin
MRINTNLTAMNTYTQYTQNNSKIASSVAKLSSGSAINTAADNATGLAISEKMRAQIRGLNKAQTNAQDAISLIQTAEGALGSSTEILQRMRELAVQSSSDTNENEIDRTALQDEFAQLQKELDDIAKNTTFNKKSLLDGSLATETKNLGTTTLANSGMTIDLGNAAAGDYNFSVTTKLESAAVEGKAPTTAELVKDGSSTYFSGTYASTATKEVAFDNVKESSLLNGNYTLTAAYADPTNDHGDGQIKVTAKGDNGQTFEAIISADTLAGLTTDNSELAIKFNAEANDAFTVNLSLKSGITASENNFDTLASNISKLNVSISGGVTQRDAEYGVYANLTGAESVKLESGMSSVTFDNGVKVNFDTLTASSVDTSNKADTAGDITATSVTATATLSGYSIEYTNFQAFDDSSITNTITGATGDFTIAAATTGVLTATVGGKDYTATVTAAQADSLEFATTDRAGVTADKTLGLTFYDADNKAAFTMDVQTSLVDATNGTDHTATTVGFANLAVSTISANGKISGAGHNYTKIFGAGTDADLTASTDSSFAVDATNNAGLTFQVGANQGDSMVINIDKMDANYLGVASSSVSTKEGAQSAIKAVDSAINQVSSQRAYLGAIQNRLDYKISNLETSTENLTSAESQIRDVDMAKEMTAFTNANILNQAATAMLAQANSLPQGVLSLIGG